MHPSHFVLHEVDRSERRLSQRSASKPRQRGKEVSDRMVLRVGVAPVGEHAVEDERDVP